MKLVVAIIPGDKHLVISRSIVARKVRKTAVMIVNCREE